jgi:hypothetical protein
LEPKQRFGTHGGIDGVPIDGVVLIDTEICNNGLPLLHHVRGRRKICLLDVLQLTDQRLLRRATGARVPLDGPGIDHDGKGEAGMGFRFRHDQLCGLINGIVGAIPVNDYAVDAAANHVLDLEVDLRRVGRTVSHIHVVRLSEPKQQMRINLRRRSRIE